MNRCLRLVVPPVMAFATLSLAACGGGEASVGGTLTGLPDSTSIVLQNNATDDLTLTNDGTFWFSSAVSAGDAYAVTVLTQPVGASCSVTSGTGTVDSSGTDVSAVVVTCVRNATIVGTVTGLPSGTSVTLSNGTVLLPIASNGAFAFPGVLAAGTAYAVTVSTQPSGHTCTVSNGTGTAVANTSTAVVVTCV